jgi:cytochrome c peroxidase
LFSDFAYKSNGLALRGTDRGREKVTSSVYDADRFKTPSLRNVAVTAPYMHDGRFRTLEEVVAHYDHGVVRTPTLDPNLAKHPNDGMKLSADDQRALVAFLRTLTDARFEDAARQSSRVPPPRRPPPPPRFVDDGN